ncbi:MAG: tyrosine-protein phosphatase, partial [Actinomycetota bacterium]|nr:tyrosine-protein phosphatase [Actinomycetota bacterium]
PAAVRHLVDDLGVTDVIDLRTVVEVAKEGDGPLVSERGVQIQHLTLYTEDTAETGVPAGERDLPWAQDPNVGHRGSQQPTTSRPHHDEYWSEHYLGYLAQRPESVVAALRTVAQSQGAVIVHCAAGKDRTGTVVGLALLLAGATDDAVTADFVASTERVPRIMERLRRRPAYAEDLEGKTAQQQSPRPDTMRRLLAALHAAGGVESVLARHGWTAEDTARLSAKLRDHS